MPRWNCCLRAYNSTWSIWLSSLMVTLRYKVLLPPVVYMIFSPFCPWSSCLSYSPPSISLLQTVKLKALREGNGFWCSGVSEQINWWFDCSSTTVSTDNKRVGEFCTVSPSSGSLGPGQSVYLEVSIRPDAIRRGEKWWKTQTHTR